jgi:antitoxin YefM
MPGWKTRLFFGGLGLSRIMYLYLYIIRLEMLTTSISGFRKDLKAYLDQVADDFETLIINRGNNTGVVVMSLQEYNALMATNHELRSKANEKRLDEALEKFNKKKSVQKDLID